MTTVNGIVYSVISNEKYSGRVGSGTSTTDQQNAMADTTIQEVSIASKVEIKGIIYKIEEVGAYAFYRCDIKKVFIPRTIKIIRASAFRYCYNMKTIRIETGSLLKTIENTAFYDGYYREDLILNTQHLKTIGSYVFTYNNRKQKMFVIPESVVSIGSGSIGGLAALEDLYYCGARQFSSEIYANGGQFLLPDNFSIHVTSKFKYDNLGGRSVTEPNYSGIYCPILPKINTCKCSYSSRNHVHLIVLILIS